MNPSPLLLGLIKRFEGCRLRAYLCPAGIRTVGWGSTGPDVKLGVSWTQEQAERVASLTWASDSAGSVDDLIAAMAKES